MLHMYAAVQLRAGGGRTSEVSAVGEVALEAVHGGPHALHSALVQVQLAHPQMLRVVLPSMARQRIT